VSTILFCIGVILEINKRCHASFGLVKTRYAGGSAGWPGTNLVPRSRGLGFTNLQHHGICRLTNPLTKLLAKVHQHSETIRESWVVTTYGLFGHRCLIDSSRPSSLVWIDIAFGLNAFQDSSRVIIAMGLPPPSSMTSGSTPKPWSLASKPSYHSPSTLYITCSLKPITNNFVWLKFK
jgi:hypothetical protein